MIALSSLTVGVVTGCGVYLMLSRDLVKLIAGTLLLSNGAVVFLLSSGYGAQEAPIHPISSADEVADPLVQALGLTAIVISFATTVFLLRVGVTLERMHESIDIEDLASAEAREEQEARRADPEEGP